MPLPPGFNNITSLDQSGTSQGNNEQDNVFIRSSVPEGSNIRTPGSSSQIQSLNSDDLQNIGSISRLGSAATQGVSSGAKPLTARVVTATAAAPSSSSSQTDWRVSLDVPAQIRGSEVLSPLANTGNRMIFPYNPAIFVSQRAIYSHISPVHTNYIFNAYQHSAVDDINITGDFFVENESDARYWIACLHFLRTMTKMFYGDNGENTGKPPMITRLNGYGKHVLNNIPVLISNFTVDMLNDVDYIQCEVNGEINYVPVRGSINVVCTPNYSRRTHSKFNLKDFANGKFVGGNEGFV